MSVTAESSEPTSARSSVSATSATASSSSSMLSCSPATPTSSARFSRRPSASTDFSERSSSRYPERSSSSWSTAAGDASSEATSSMSVQNCPARGSRPPGDAGLDAVAEGLIEGEPGVRGVGIDLGHRGGPNPPLGHAQGPLHAHLIAGVGDRLEVGHGVAHLPAVVEAGATHQLVGDLGFDQLLLHRPGLGVGAVEDGHLGQAHLLLIATPDDLADHVAGLVLLVVGVVADDAGS